MTRRLRRNTARTGQLADGWERLLREHCGRVGIFLFLRDHPEWTRLMDDKQFRNEHIAEIWNQHGTELLERWSIEHQDVEPSVVRWLAKNR